MSHTSKKCRKIWQFIGIFMLTCVVSVLPASLAGAQRATKSTVAQMEKEVGRLELDIPIETSRVGWTYVPILNIYPSNTTGPMRIVLMQTKPRHTTKAQLLGRHRIVR